MEVTSGSIFTTWVATLLALIGALLFGAAVPVTAGEARMQALQLNQLQLPSGVVVQIDKLTVGFSARTMGTRSASGRAVNVDFRLVGDEKISVSDEIFRELMLSGIVFLPASSEVEIANLTFNRVGTSLFFGLFKIKAGSSQIFIRTPELGWTEGFSTGSSGVNNQLVSKAIQLDDKWSSTGLAAKGGWMVSGQDEKLNLAYRSYALLFPGKIPSIVHLGIGAQRLAAEFRDLDRDQRFIKLLIAQDAANLAAIEPKKLIALALVNAGDNDWLLCDIFQRVSGEGGTEDHFAIRYLDSGLTPGNLHDEIASQRARNLFELFGKRIADEMKLETMQVRSTNVLGSKSGEGVQTTRSFKKQGATWAYVDQ